MSLVWTTKPPTEPGRYLCQVGPGEYMGYVTRNTVGTLHFHGINRICESIAVPLNVPIVSAKWAGPIPKPTEADHA